MNNILTTEEKINLIRWISSSENKEELAKRYDSVAESWDSNTSGYLTPQQIIKKFTLYLQNDAKILDAGCGTGIIGQLLSEQGYENIQGCDLSEGMLKEANNKGYYRKLSQQELGRSLTFLDNSFNAIVYQEFF
jgi:predicted TPR repeat methyltransferase